MLFEYLSTKFRVPQLHSIPVCNAFNHKSLNLFVLNKLALSDSKQVHFKCVLIIEKEMPPYKKKEY